MQYSCMEEQKQGNSYEVEVKEGKWNRPSYVVLLCGGTEERKTVMKQKQKKGNGTDKGMQYSCIEEQKKGTV